MSQSDDELRQILFKAADGITDMADDEIAQIKQVFAAHHARLLEGLRGKMPEKYDLSGISDPYVEYPYEWGANNTLNIVLTVIDAEIDHLKETKA